MAEMVLRRRIAYKGQALGRSVKKVREAFRRQDRGGARLRGHGRRPAHRQRNCADPAPDSGLHARRADYDVLVAADESEVFAAYLLTGPRDPRPVAGSAGLVPTSWDASMEQWGATQLQNRFMKKFSRRMTALDMQAWTAARMIGEAVTRRNRRRATVRHFFSARIFACRLQRPEADDQAWNLQLRQPILLSDGRNIVSISPQEGFLHQVSELDTLGVDQPETKCELK